MRMPNKMLSSDNLKYRQTLITDRFEQHNAVNLMIQCGASHNIKR